MLTNEKYKEMGFTVQGNFVIDRHGAKYFPKKSKAPAKAIRLFCFECNGWDRRKLDSGKPYDAVKDCVDPLCPLFDFRFGRNVFIKGGKGNIEALEKARSTRSDT